MRFRSLEGELISHERITAQCPPTQMLKLSAFVRFDFSDQGRRSFVGERDLGQIADDVWTSLLGHASNLNLLEG